MARGPLCGPRLLASESFTSIAGNQELLFLITRRKISTLCALNWRLSPAISSDACWSFESWGGGVGLAAKAGLSLHAMDALRGKSRRRAPRGLETVCRKFRGR